MGLINLYNAMSMVPHIPYRFKAEIWPNHDGQYIPNANTMGIEFAVKRISQPTFKMNTENKKVFGNTAHVVPILKFGETTMEITFEENDDMLVFKTLAGYMGNELYTGIPGGLINIRITQFDNSMNIIVDKRVYVCRLKEHGMPSFNNNGFGSPVEISATFNVIYVMEEPIVIDTTIDENGKVTVNRDKLPDNETVELELQKVVEEEGKQQKKKEEERERFGGHRTPEMEKRTQEAQENLQKKSDELNSAVNNLLDIYYIQNQDAVDKYLNDANSALSQNAWKNFANERAKQFGTSKDASTLTPEERSKLEEEWKHMKTREKFKYGTGIDAANGLDDTEIGLMNTLIDNIDDDAMQADYDERLSGILDKNNEYNAAKAEYEEAKNESLPPGSSNSTFNESDPIRYREGANTNAAAGVDNLETAINAGRVTDANGNQITSPKDFKSMGKYFVDGHQYKAVFYDKKWSLNSDISGNDFSYERAAANPEEVFQNVLADGPIKYNLGGKSDGNINDGLDCMGFIGVVTQATGADVVDINGNKLKYNKVKEIFANTNAANFFNNDFRVVVPPGTNMKVFVAKKGETSGHIYVEYNGYIYESASGQGVIKTEKSKWKNKGGLKYKDVTATEEQVAQFQRNSKNKTS